MITGLSALIAHPWVQAAIEGLVLGVLGAVSFISLSWLIERIIQEKRSRRVLTVSQNESPLQVPLKSGLIEHVHLKRTPSLK
jgi:hypothetical protein